MGNSLGCIYSSVNDWFTSCAVFYLFYRLPLFSALVIIPAIITRTMLGQEPAGEDPADRLNRYVRASMAGFIAMIIGNFFLIMPLAVWRVRVCFCTHAIST